MPVYRGEGVPGPTSSFLASGGEGELIALDVGVIFFPTTDSRDNVGFLGSLHLPRRTKSKPVTPVIVAVLLVLQLLAAAISV
jgi:hypothetical protein